MKRALVWTLACTLFAAVLGSASLALRWRSRRRSVPLPSLDAASVLPRPEAVTPPPPEGHDGRVDPDGTGRQARTPGEIPAKGWWGIARRVFRDVSDDRLLAEAAGVTFYTLLAIFPALTALVSLYGLIADPKTIADNLSAVTGVLPEGGMQILDEQVKSLTSGPSKGLGLGAVLGLLASLWSANAGMKALFDALNVVYEEKEKRGFVLRTLLTLGFTAGALLFIVLAMAGVVVLPAALHLVGLDRRVSTLLDLARWPVLMVFLTLFLAAVYRYGPSREKPRWRWVSWGGVAATLCWLAVSFAFSFYVGHFGNYNKTYGSLGAAVGFMTWIWLSTSVVLIGAEMNAEMEHQTARDTTVGPEQPLGSRRAVKADEVAAAS